MAHRNKEAFAMTAPASIEFFTVSRINGGHLVLDWTGAAVVGYKNKKLAEDAARGWTLSLFGAAEAYDDRLTYVKAYLASRASRVPAVSLQGELF
jgi:hypothetical protein